jgi:sulfite exporter TauE/SafE
LAGWPEHFVHWLLLPGATSSFNLMRDSSSEERLGPSQQPVRLFDLLRAVAYLALGGWMVYTANRPMAASALLPLSHQARLILGGLLVIYGIVRLVRALPFKLRKSRPNDFH